MIRVTRIDWPGATRLVQIAPGDELDPTLLRGALVKVSGTVSQDDFLTIDRAELKRRIVSMGACGVITSIQAETTESVDCTPIDDLDASDPIGSLMKRLPERFPDDARRSVAESVIQNHFQRD